MTHDTKSRRQYSYWVVQFHRCHYQIQLFWQYVAVLRINSVTYCQIIFYYHKGKMTHTVSSGDVPKDLQWYRAQESLICA